MTPRIERLALEQLAALLLEKAGLKITPDGYYGLRLALQTRLPLIQVDDAEEYVRQLRGHDGADELRNLLPLVTVGKTEFFRDTRQFDGFANIIFPQVVAQARREGRPARIWSAGCATGEEPYSIAMVARDALCNDGEVEIRASDLNSAAVETAKAGRFPARRMPGVSEERLAAYFEETQGHYTARESLKSLIRFESHNLAAPDWGPQNQRAFDVIFCRNVIIYFDTPTIKQVMERFYEALRPGGWLLLGYSETLFKLPTRFEMVDLRGAFAYQRSLDVMRQPVDSLVERALSGRPSAPPPLYSVSPSGIFAIPTAASSAPTPNSVRVAQLMPKPVAPPLSAPRPHASAPRASAPPAPRPPPSAPRSPVERLAETVKLIEAGDFLKALRLARINVDEAPNDLAALLTYGNVQALMGSIDNAREAYTLALAKEPLCVEARLYLALAALQANAADEARAELTKALFLEPTLAVGHYLLGQVLESKGEAEAARRSYRNAMALKRSPTHDLIGHFPDLPRSNEAIAQAAQYRLAALAELP